MRLAHLPLALLTLSLPAVAAGEPEADFEALVRAVAERSHDASCAAMEAWIERNPASPSRARGLLWMARLRLMDERADLARPLLTRAVELGRGTRWELPAEKELADQDLAEHHFEKALATYQRLSAEPDPYWQSIGKSSILEGHAARVRWIAFCLCLTALMALSLSRLALAWRAGRKPWRVPREVVVVAPLLGLLAVAALGQPEAEARAVIEIALGGLALLWVAGATLRGRPHGVARRLGEALLGLGEAAALGYCALAGNGLWTKLVDTLVMGAGE